MANAIFSGLRKGIFGDNSKEQDRLEEALRYFTAVQVPTVEEQQVQLDQMVQQGVITPEQAEYYKADPSAYESMVVDPRGREAELMALDKLQGIIGSGGMDAQARARLSQIQDQIGTSSRGAREAIMQNANERGIGGSGFELVNKLTEQQGSATRANQAAVQAAADAEQRALQAISQSATVGSNVRGQDYAQEAAKASAIDAINKFNTQNKQTVAGENVDRRNAAAVKNLSEKQRIADANTEALNKNKIRNKELIQSKFNNEITKAQGASGQLKGLAESDRTQQGKDEKFTGDVMSKIGTAMAAMMSDEREKKDVRPAGDDLDEFMSSLDPKAFRYKDLSKGGTAPGEQVGVMAQDLEKTKVGRTMVKNTPEGKKIDPMRAISVMLAALAEISENGGDDA